MQQHSAGCVGCIWLYSRSRRATAGLIKILLWSLRTSARSTKRSRTRVGAYMAAAAHIAGLFIRSPAWRSSGLEHAPAMSTLVHIHASRTYIDVVLVRKLLMRFPLRRSSSLVRAAARRRSGAENQWSAGAQSASRMGGSLAAPVVAHFPGFLCAYSHVASRCRRWRRWRCSSWLGLQSGQRSAVPSCAGAVVAVRAS